MSEDTPIYETRGRKPKGGEKKMKVVCFIKLQTIKRITLLDYHEGGMEAIRKFIEENVEAYEE